MNKSLVEQNRPTLATFVGANAVLIYLAIIGYSPDTTITSVIDTLLKSAAATTVFGILVVLLGGLLPASAKSRIVFLRWSFALPGHRAFEEKILKDPRINRANLEKKLGKLPTEPGEQNTTWYRFYKKHESKPSVTQSHASFLLTREMTTIGLILFVVYMAGVSWKPEMAKNFPVPLGALLIIETVLSWMAARTYATSFVADVLAEESV